MSDQQLMAVTGDGDLLCNLCNILLVKKGETEDGIPQMIQLHFELFHDRLIEIHMKREEEGS